MSKLFQAKTSSNGMLFSVYVSKMQWKTSHFCLLPTYRQCIVSENGSPSVQSSATGSSTQQPGKPKILHGTSTLELWKDHNQTNVQAVTWRYARKSYRPDFRMREYRGTQGGIVQDKRIISCVLHPTDGERVYYCRVFWGTQNSTKRKDSKLVSYPNHVTETTTGHPNERYPRIDSQSSGIGVVNRIKDRNLCHAYSHFSISFPPPFSCFLYETSEHFARPPLPPHPLRA